tara:strand:+ start:63 stop:497 length:435 start_codon:yes stop_codon:yes gene_type:complete
MKKPSTFKMKNPALAKFVKRAGSPMRVDPETEAYRKKRKEEKEREHKELNRKLAALDKDDPKYKKKRQDIINRSEGIKANKRDKEGLTREEYQKKNLARVQASKDYVKSKGGYAGLNMKKDKKGIYRDPDGYTVSELMRMEKKS